MALRTLNLSAVMNGGQAMPDGKTVRLYGFKTGDCGCGGMGARTGGGGMGGGITVPAPLITVNEGDDVEITVFNHSMMEHTLHLHGLDVDMANDGDPMTYPAIPPMGSYTYRFKATYAGTYFYHCHVHTVFHQQMGMYGPLVVKAANGVNQAWTGGPSYDKEYVWVLSEYDSVWHNSPEGSVNYSYYNPDYFLINGKANPTTSSDSKTVITAKKNQTILLRLINAGYLIDTVSLGGLPFKVIASDGRPLASPVTVTQQKIAPGERYDLLATLSKTGNWTAEVQYLNWYGQTVKGKAYTKITVSL
jgi:FtsP/CotA-like multicopper oxidase with cupredoxin domain